MDQLTKGGKFSSDFYSFVVLLVKVFFQVITFHAFHYRPSYLGRSQTNPMNTENTSNAHDFLPCLIRPRAIVYHEGNQYVIGEVILPPDQGEALPTEKLKFAVLVGITIN